MGDHEHLDMSIGLGLTSNEHVALTGLATSRRSAKDLMLRYDEVLSERLQRESEQDALLHLLRWLKRPWATMQRTIQRPRLRPVRPRCSDPLRRRPSFSRPAPATWMAKRG